MGTEFREFDVAEFLDSEEVIAAYLQEVLEEDDPQAFIKAVGDVARARSMTEISRKTGLARQNLYRQFAADGNPSFFTVKKVLDAMNVNLVPTAKA
jgi:probable addiction module antidote protein